MIQHHILPVAGSPATSLAACGRTLTLADIGLCLLPVALFLTIISLA